MNKIQKVIMLISAMSIVWIMIFWTPVNIYDFVRSGSTLTIRDIKPSHIPLFSPIDNKVGAGSYNYGFYSNVDYGILFIYVFAILILGGTLFLITKSKLSKWGFMKKLLSIIIICLLLIPLASCYKAPVYDITIYKTSSGAKYHKEKCRYVKGKSIEINISKAIYDTLHLMMFYR